MKRHAGFLITLALLSGCKPLNNGNSGLKTLDNLAAGTRIRTNQCAASPKERGTSKRTQLFGSIFGIDGKYQNLVKIAQEVSTAIPADLQEIFLQNDGQIIISPSTNEICSRDTRRALAEYSNQLKKSDNDSQRLQEILTEQLKILQEGQSGIQSCFVFSPRAGMKSQILNIYLQADEEAIRHGLVRAFGHLLSDFYAKMFRVADTNPVEYVQLLVDKPEIRNIKRSLKQAFLTDMSRAEDGIGSFKRYAPDGNSSEQEKYAFAGWVFAEAFDSYFCNSWHTDKEKNTRNIMIRDFGETYKVFQRFVNGNQNFQLTSLDNNENASSDDVGFSLAGRRSSRSRASSSQSQSSAMWGAFWGSISDNTGYTAYKKSVTKHVNKNYDPNKGVLRNAVSSSGAVVSNKTGYDSYKRQVRKRVEKNYDPSKSVASNAIASTASIASDKTGYTKLRKQIESNVDKSYTENGGSISKAVAQGLGTTSVERYGDYKRNTQKSIDQRMETFGKRGYSANASAFHSFTSFAGEPVGATDIGYRGFGGFDPVTGNNYTVSERFGKVGTGALKVGGTIGGVQSIRSIVSRGGAGKAAGGAGFTDDVANTTGAGSTATTGARAGSRTAKTTRPNTSGVKPCKVGFSLTDPCAKIFDSTPKTGEVVDGKWVQKSTGQLQNDARLATKKSHQIMEDDFAARQMGPGRQMQMSVKPRVKRDFGTNNIDEAVEITKERYLRSMSDLQRHHTQGTLRTTSDIGRVEEITNLRKSHLDMKRMQRIKKEGNLAQEMTLDES